MQDASRGDTRRLILMLLIIGGITSLFLLIAVSEYTLLKGEMALVQQKLVLAIENQVGDGSVLAYITSMFLWTVVLGFIMGTIWSKILFPSLPFIEKFMASLALGTFIMPMNFIVLTTSLSAFKLYEDFLGIPLPAYFGETMGKVVTLFGTNQEQGYELFNVSVFIILGFIILGIQGIIRSRRTSVMIR